jgi:SAM-dependent methyltransferase
MFWFNRQDPRGLFVDKRKETISVTDHSHGNKDGRRLIVISPDLVADFTCLPFKDGRFSVVVFDPPHLVMAGRKSWLASKYGSLKGDWKEELRKGFAECFRVLKSDGVLVFKWNETNIPVSEILKLTPERPLFGNRSGKQSKTHWIVFLK